jgi:hypothetical protein
MITSKQITEEYAALMDARNHKTPIYVNPTSSDLLDLNKSIKGSDKYVRFIADAKTQKVYVWNGFNALHTDAVTSLKLGSYHSVRDQPNILFGYSYLKNGKLVLTNQSDSIEKLGSVVDSLSSYKLWDFSASELKDKFGNDIKKDSNWATAFFIYNWSFLSKYISGTSQYIDREKTKFIEWKKSN